MAVISTLVARMIADLSGWTPNMEKGKRDMSSFGSAAKGLQKTLGGLGVGFSIAGMAYGALNLSKKANETLDLAQGLGTSVEGLQGLRYATAAAGGNVESLTRGLNQMLRRLYNTTGATDQVSKSLRQLGISAKTIREDPVSAMMQLSDSMMKMKGSSEFSKVAFDLFGRSNIEMLPLLELGSEGIKKYADEAERLGAVLSSAELMQAEKISIRVAQAGQIASSLGQKALASASTLLEVFKRMGDLQVYQNRGPIEAFMNAWNDLANAEDAAVQARFNRAKMGKEYEDQTEARNKNLKEYLAIMDRLQTPQEKLNEQLLVADMALKLNQTALSEYNKTISRLFDEFDRPEIEKMNKWAESLIDKSLTPLQKYKEGLMEVIQLREYFMRDTVLTSGEQGTLLNLAAKYQDEAYNELKPESGAQATHSLLPSYRP